MYLDHKKEVLKTYALEISKVDRQYHLTKISNKNEIIKFLIGRKKF